MENLIHKYSDIILHLRYGLRLNKPKLIVRIITSYLKALVSPIPPLKYIDFSIDFRCNLMCKHCFATSLKNPRSQMLAIEDYKRIAKECEQMGVLQVSFQGGEPLMIPSLEKVIQAFDPQKFYIAITTNGTLLTPKKVSWLKSIGVDKITVSLDSMNPKEHDEFRRVPGTFDKAWNGIQEAIKQGFPVTINTCITHQNLHTEGIQKIFDYSKTHKIIVNPIFAAPVGRWIYNTSYLLTKDDVAYITKLQKDNPYLRRDLDSNYFKRGCPAVKEVIYVTPYGEVIPCPFLHVIVGDLQKESLESIIKRGLSFGPFRKYHSTCLAAENIGFIKRLQRTGKRVKHIPFTLKELEETT